MTAIVLLFVSGALLLAGEVFLPGGIAGVIGGVLLALGALFSYMQFGPGAGSIATLAALALVGLTLYLELIWWPKTKLGRAMVVDAVVGGQSQPPPASKEVIGKSATAVTMLAPTGLVEIAGQRYEAFCQSGLAARGAALTVVGLDNFRLIVTANKIT
ncbi:MAG: NfeD family protein [Opitutaceae bacterium]